MKNDDYIPIEFYREAKAFIKEIDEDVELYKKIRMINAVKPNLKADNFTAYWTLERYENFPHALIFLYEKKNDIVESIELNCSGIADSFEALQLRLIKYYDVLKENGKIE